MAFPQVRAIGSSAGVGASGGSFTPVNPTHAADDILLCFVEGSENGAASFSIATAGWAEVTDSPQFADFLGGSNGDVTLAVFWKRATSAAETDPQVDGALQQARAWVVSFSGCITSGNPWDVTAGANTGGTQTTAASAPGDTTTVADCLIVVAIANSSDTSVAQYSSWANTDLANVTELINENSSQGAGGGLGVVTGEKATAGAFGVTTATVALSSVLSYHVIALKPPTGNTLSFTVQPSNAVEGVAISPSIEVTSTDNTFTGNVTLAIQDNPSSGTLSGTLTQAAVAGVATFNDIEIDNPGTAYTLSASAAGHPAVESSAFNITLEAANQLAFNVQPTGTTVASVIAPSVKVGAWNSEGVLDTNFVGNITVAIGTNPPGTGVLGGTLTRAAVAGVATFDDLTIDTAGTGYTLTAASAPLAGATSVAFNITAGVAINITWIDTSTIEDGFKLERKDGAGSFVEIATPAADAVSYTDDVAAAQTYVYRIRSYNANGNSSYSNEDTVVVP